MYYVLHCVWLGKGAGVAWIDSQTRYVCVCVCVCVLPGGRCELLHVECTLMASPEESKRNQPTKSLAQARDIL